MYKSEDILFIEGLREGNLSKLRSVAKADLHNHAGLGMRFATFNKWAGDCVNAPPKKMNGINSIGEYIRTNTIKLITKGQDMTFLIEETVKEAIEDGVKILEASISCDIIRFYNNWEEFFKTITNIKDKYSPQIDFRPEVGAGKGMPAEDLEILLPPCIDSGVFKSIDIYGDETIESFDMFKEYYRYAKKKGLKLKAHAGEFQGAENVRKAVEILELDELQHGIGAASSEYVMDLIKERNIRCHICPSSNFILGAVSDMRSHPVRRLFDRGISVTINTDDLMLFDSGVAEEYLYLYKLGLFHEDELNEIRKKSLL